MLKVPSFAYYDDLRVSVYQDDTMFWKFYFIPDYISIRKDINGNPVFLLIKYAFGDQDREENPDLPRGGGYMAFDVEMRVPETDRDVLLDRLQTWVNQEWNRLKVLAESHNSSVQGARLSSWYYHDNQKRTQTLNVEDVRLGLPVDRPEAPPGDRPPMVVLDVPTWVSGTFSVTAPQAESLVTHRVTEGPLSLVGSNTASANMDLTSAGATFMERTLVNPDGSGGSDLTPIQVRFDLKFWARIPPIRLQVEADTRSLYAALESIEHDYDGHDCSEDDMSHYQSQLEMAVSANLIKVRFDTGTLDLKEDFVQEIRSTAMELVQDIIKDRFYQKKDEAPPAEGDDKDKFVDEEKDIRYLKIAASVDYTRIEYDETITSIQEWEIHPQGTMQTFFADMGPDEISKYVRVVDLDDDFFKTLGLKVSAFANWDANPIAFVETQILYTGLDENKKLVEKPQSFTFSKANTTGEWDPSLIGKKREYEYRYRIAYTGKEPGPWSRTVRTRAPHLNLSIPDAGKVKVSILAGNINWAQTVEQVQVEMSYEDRTKGVPKESMTFKLTDGVEEQVYERFIFEDWDRPVTYKCKFFLKDGQVIETDEEETVSRQLLINAPLFDKLDVRMVPSGKWGGVVQTVVSLTYDDPDNDYHADEAFSLKGIDEFKTWSVVLRDPTQRRFRYKVLTTFENGDMHETQFAEVDGDQALPITVRQTPHLDVDVLAGTVDFAATPIVQATLRYKDDAAGINEVETFVFSKGDVTHWDVPLASDKKRSYSHEITYHTADGGKIEREETVTDEEALVIPRVAAPEVKCVFVPRLLNFTDTPVVQADINYSDPDNDIEFSDTLVFTDNKEQSFRVPVNENSPLDYRLMLTYFRADGDVAVQPEVTTHSKRFVIPLLVENGNA